MICVAECDEERQVIVLKLPLEDLVDVKLDGERVTVAMPKMAAAMLDMSLQNALFMALLWPEDAA